MSWESIEKSSILFWEMSDKRENGENRGNVVSCHKKTGWERKCSKLRRIKQKKNPLGSNIFGVEGWVCIWPLFSPSTAATCTTIPTGVISSFSSTYKAYMVCVCVLSTSTLAVELVEMLNNVTFHFSFLLVSTILWRKYKKKMLLFSFLC